MLIEGIAFGIGGYIMLEFAMKCYSFAVNFIERELITVIGNYMKGLSYIARRLLSTLDLKYKYKYVRTLFIHSAHTSKVIC